MAFLLQNKVAVITGSSQGIGAATAKLLAEHGASVVVNYRKNHKQAESVVNAIIKKKGKAFACQADVTQPSNIKKLVKETLKHYGRIDIWINNASEYTAPQKVTAVSWSEYLTEFEGTIKTTLLCCQAVIPVMQKQHYGRIINLGSTFITRPATGYSAHATAKSALLGLTRSLAKELGKHHITVNMVSPGMVLTSLSLRGSASDRSNLALKTPLTRLAAPDDIARAVLFFASDLSSFITGSYLPVDGGLSMP